MKTYQVHPVTAAVFLSVLFMGMVAILVMLPILEESGLKVEADFFLSHSPERVDPGNARYTTKNTSKVVGGFGPNSQTVGP